MKISEVQAVVLDLDGTTLKNDLTISDGTMAVLAELKSRNIPIYIATGRMPQAAVSYHALLELDTPLICANGAMIYDRSEGRLVAQEIIPNNEVLQIFDYFTDKMSNILSFYQDDYYCLQQDFFVDMWIEKFLVQPKYIGNYRELLNHDIHKFEMILKDTQTVFQLTEETSWSSSVNIYAGRGYMEIVPKLATKWNAIEGILQQQGISLEKTMAFGDGSNDVEMLAGVGIGVAMDNAHDSVKQHARHVTRSNEEDGIAYFLSQRLEG